MKITHTIMIQFKESVRKILLQSKLSMLEFLIFKRNFCVSVMINKIFNKISIKLNYI